MRAFAVSCLVLATASVAWADNHNAASCAQANVAAAVNAASDGDTVSIPAGTCQWSTAVAVKKRLLIQGAGDTATKLSGSGTLFTAPVATASGFRLTGLEISDCRYCITVYGAVKGFRVDHNSFKGGGGILELRGDITGVFDHNTVTDVAHTHIVFYGPNTSVGQAPFPFELGTANAFFVESNTYHVDNVCPGHLIASNSGSRYVFRHNQYIQTNTSCGWLDSVDAHGFCEVAGRGSFTWEIYRNTFEMPSNKDYGRLIHLRGGQGVVFDNQATGRLSKMITLTDYRTCNPPCVSGSVQDVVNHSYFWSNSSGGSPVDPTNACPEAIQVNRDYWTTAMPGYVPYVYPHPLTGETPPPPPPDKVFAPEQCIEAESGTLVAPMATVTDATASGGAFVATQTSDQGEVSFELDVTEAGAYVVQASLRTPDPATSHNSFFFGVDGEAASGASADVFDAATASAFTWDNVSRRGAATGAVLDPYTLTLSAGRHVIHFYGRESNAQLDRVVLRRCPGNDCARVDGLGCGCSDGSTRACYTGAVGTAGTGICKSGTQTCAAGSWGACLGEIAPIAEECNGVDDDCDGFTDEDWPTLGADCSSGLGACAASGVFACSADGSGLACDATPLAPTPESCGNAVDEDCDGALDNGCACTDGAQRSCYSGAASTAGVGACKAGTQTCVNHQWQACVGEVTPIGERCTDGLDNDCDGVADALDVTDCTCLSGDSGACYSGPQGTQSVGSCRAGTRACISGQWGACEGEIVPQEEICNDQLDNDCDGAVDAADAEGCTNDLPGVDVGTVNITCAAAPLPLAGAMALLGLRALLLALRAASRRRRG